MSVPENALTNHEVTVCLSGGAVLGPFNATWSRDEGGDVRERGRGYGYNRLPGAPYRGTW